MAGQEIMAMMIDFANDKIAGELSKDALVLSTLITLHQTLKSENPIQAASPSNPRSNPCVSIC